MSAEKETTAYYDTQLIPEEAITKKDLEYMTEIITDYLEVDKPARCLESINVRLIVDYCYSEQDE